MKQFQVIIESPDEFNAADIMGNLKVVKWVDGVTISEVTEPQTQINTDDTDKGKMTLEDYLRKNLNNIIIDHALRAEIIDGLATFYIHPANVSGDTLDFIVEGNTLSPRNLSGPLNSNNINQGTLTTD